MKWNLSVNNMDIDKPRGCRIGCLPLVLIIIILWLLSRCANITEPQRALHVRADFFVSTITKAGSVCVKEKCELSIANNEVCFLSNQHALIVDQLEFIQSRNAVGTGSDGKQWEVTVGTMRREPYLLLLKSNTVAILVGYECY